MITAGLDGHHMQGSLHYVGLALDLRTRDLPPGAAERYASALRAGLGKAWDIVVEGDHVHVEYDPKP